MLEATNFESWTDEEINGLSEFASSMISRDNSLLSTVTLFALSFSSFEVDITWLDEISEGLKNVMIATNKIVVNLLN